MKNISVAVLLFGLCALASATYCPAPKHICKKHLDGFGYFGGFPVGSKVSFCCPHGYILHGHKESRCMTYGDWYPKPPICSPPPPPRCPARDAPDYGDVNPKKDEYKPGDKIMFSCYNGYKLIGNSHDICQKNGKWAVYDTPKCVRVTCPRRDPPKNGQVTPAQNKYFVGQMIKFSCNKGFYLKGKEKDRCEKNGKWAIDETPKCIKRCFIKDVNKYLIWEPEKKAYEPGDMVDFECKHPYVLVGEDKFKCQHDGTWNPGKFPVCVNKCFPPKIRYGGVIDEKDFYLSGEYVRYYCRKGYMLTVARKARCLANGEWSAVAVCKPEVKKCKGHDIDNGYVDPDQDWHDAGDMIEYHCKPGYKLDSEHDENKCLKNGYWQYPIPSCKKAPKGSCKNRCIHQYLRGSYYKYTCQCHSLCYLDKTCCDDYNKYCGQYYVPLY